METESVQTDKPTVSTQIARPMLVLIMLLGWAVLCVLMFFQFQPDQLSLSDRYFPSPTNTPTRTPTPTVTPNYAATQQVLRATATAEAIQSTVVTVRDNWNSLLLDRFDKNNNKWDIGSDNGSYSDITRQIAAGKYRWEVTSKKGFIGWIPVDTKSLTDFYASVEIQQTAGSNLTDYGLLFRMDANDNFFYFGIDADRFAVFLNNKDEWFDIIPWTPAEAIQLNEPNRLGVIAQGSHFIFLINDQYVGEAFDQRLPLGKVALAIEVSAAGLKTTFEFDNFELRVP